MIIQHTQKLKRIGLFLYYANMFMYFIICNTKFRNSFISYKRKFFCKRIKVGDSFISYQPYEQKYLAFIFVRQTFYLQSKEIDFCFIMRWSCIVLACKTKFSLFVMRYM